MLAHHLTAGGQIRHRCPSMAKGRRARPQSRGACGSRLPPEQRTGPGLHSASVIRARCFRTEAARCPRYRMGCAQRLARPGSLERPSSALRLAKTSGHSAALLSVLENVCVNVLTQGRVAESLDWVKELFDAATAAADSSLMIAAHVAGSGTHYWLGELRTGREHADRVLALYDEEKHHRLAVDPRTRAGNWAAPAAWMLGFPDQAVRISDEKDGYARRRGQPFDLGLALSAGAAAFDLRREPEELRTRARECERLGHENGMPVLWAILAPISYA